MTALIIYPYTITYTLTMQRLSVQLPVPTDEKPSDQIETGSRKKQFSIDAICTEAISSNANIDF